MLSEIVSFVFHVLTYGTFYLENNGRSPFGVCSFPPNVIPAYAGVAFTAFAQPFCLLFENE